MQQKTKHRFIEGLCYKLLIMVLSSTIGLHLGAQQSNYGNWFAYNGNNAIHKKWNWLNEIKYRNYNIVGDFEQLILRTGIGQNIGGKNNNILLGYSFVQSNKYATNSKVSTPTTEHQILQQFTHIKEYKGIRILHRYRLEERFMNSDVSLRFRYFLSLNVPINNSTMKKNTVYASVYNEVFLNSKSPVFDRDRLYGGLGYVLTNNLRFEMGSMTQVYEHTNRSQFQLIFYNNIPLKK